jgi:hypothetical protein
MVLFMRAVSRDPSPFASGFSLIFYGPSLYQRGGPIRFKADAFANN